MDESTVIKFKVSTACVGSEIEEEFTLEELGFTGEETEKEIEEEVDKMWADWVFEHIDGGWSFKDE